MYIFGGREESGNDLGDLAAFDLTTYRWYTFQNTGPSPSPRSGHSMSCQLNKIYLIGGESSSGATDIEELSMIYTLDTSKIRYPKDDPRKDDSESVTETKQKDPKSANREEALSVISSAQVRIDKLNRKYDSATTGQRKTFSKAFYRVKGRLPLFSDILALLKQIIDDKGIEKGFYKRSIDLGTLLENLLYLATTSMGLPDAEQKDPSLLRDLDTVENLMIRLLRDLACPTSRYDWMSPITVVKKLLRSFANCRHPDFLSMRT